MKELFRGDLVRLTAEDPETYAKTDVNWQRDSEFVRLVGGELALSSEKKLKEWAEKRIEKDLRPDRYPFSIRTLADDKLIGFLSLWVDLIHSDASVGIGIGDRESWSKGYGTDAMKLALRYAFLELGLQRVSLTLHEYNPRAQRSYEKAGFRFEGRTRQEMMREGRRTDVLWMGVLREEWLDLQNGANS